MKIKENLYVFLSKRGISLFQKVFPEYFAREPLKPTDRFIEYPFLVLNLPKAPAKVLDVGCAGSFFPLMLAGFGYDVYGIDIREYAILNRLKFNNFQFIKEDIGANSFPDNFFDAVLAISTVEHIGLSGRYGAGEDAFGDKKAMLQIKRVLKPKGILILTVPFGKAKTIKPYNRVYDVALINELMGGFRIEKEEYYMLDSRDNWYKCPKEEAAAFDSNESRYAVCLIKAVKETG